MPDDDYDDPIAALTDRLMAHPKARELLETAQTFVDRLGNAIDRVAQPRPRAQIPRRPAPSRPRPPPPPPPKPDPRLILGFPASEVLTRDSIKKRRQELSRIFHPDHGGNGETMQRINAAADELLALL